MSTPESLQYDADQDYALEFALDRGQADYCDCHGNPHYLKDLTEVLGKLYCPDGIIDLDESQEALEKSDRPDEA